MSARILRVLVAVIFFGCAGVAQAAGVHPAGRRSDDAQRRRLEQLEAGVRAAEGVRAVKRLQNTYSHYLDSGLWSDLADLFTDDAIGEWPGQTVKGRS